MKLLEKVFIVLSILSSFFLISLLIFAIWQKNQNIQTVSAQPKQQVQKDIEEESESKPVLILPLETETTTADPYPYYIKVNRAANCVTIYTKDENGEYTVPCKAMICSAGYDTPLGKFDSKGKYEMKGLINDVYGQYATWITGNILFHSVPSREPTKDSVSVRNYNQLGTTASAGCIRLTVADAKWIYDNCSLGTGIEIYDEADNPGPLGKPEAIKLPEESKWDPTDPDPKNPWNEKNPEIQVSKKTEYFIGESIDLLEGVKAWDTCGNEITNKIYIEGSINNAISGTYKVTYHIQDAIGKTAEREVIYQVKESENK